MLLEVIVALGLLVFGLAVVALQINTGLKTAESNRLYTQAMMLVDSKLDEVEAGVIQPDMIEREVKGHFGILYPGYTWRIEINPTEIEDFYMAEMKIGYRESAVREQIDDPKKEIDIEDPGTITQRTAYRLFPKPADINLERDYGLSTEDMDGMLADLEGVDPVDDTPGGDGGGGGGGGWGGGPGGGAGGPGGAGGTGGAGTGGGGGPPGGGGRRGGPRVFGGGGGAGGPPGGGGGLPGGGALPAGMDQAQLAELLKMLLEMSDSGSFDPRMLTQLPDEQFMAIAEILETMGMGRGNMSNLKDMYQGAAGGRPGMSRVGEARRGFGRAGGQPNTPGGPGVGGRPDGGRPGGGDRQPGAGNRPPGSGNRSPGSGGQANPPARPGGSGRGNNSANRGGTGNAPPAPRDPNQPDPRGER